MASVRTEMRTPVYSITDILAGKSLVCVQCYFCVLLESLLGRVVTQGLISQTWTFVNRLQFYLLSLSLLLRQILNSLLHISQISTAVNNFLRNKTAYRRFSSYTVKNQQTQVECFHKAESPLDACQLLNYYIFKIWDVAMGYRIRSGELC